jgi:hypothetical protein
VLALVVCTRDVLAKCFGVKLLSYDLVSYLTPGQQVLVDNKLVVYISKLSQLLEYHIHLFNKICALIIGVHVIFEDHFYGTYIFARIKISAAIRHGWQSL